MLQADGNVVAVLFHEYQDNDIKDKFAKIQEKFPNIDCYHVNTTSMQHNQKTIKQYSNELDSQLDFKFFRCTTLVGGVKYYSKWAD